MNKVFLVGRLGQEPTTREANGTTVTNWSMATTEKWKDKTGNWQEKTEWHRCQAWGPLATNMAKWTTKGTQVLAEGKLATREWTDKEGKKNWTTEIIVSNVQFLSDTKKQEATTPAQTNTNWSAAPTDNTGYAQADIPF